MRSVPFGRLLAAVATLGVALGALGYALSGTPTNKGTTGAIGAENATIRAAEKESCHKNGRYGTVATLEREGLLRSAPIYNSVVYLPGHGCGTIVVGSPAYQPAAG